MKKSTVAFSIVVVIGIAVIVLIQSLKPINPTYNVPIAQDTVVVAVNIERTNQGRPALVEDPILDQLAEDMIASTSFTSQDELDVLNTGRYGAAGGLTANNMLGTAQLIFQLKSNQPANYNDMVINPLYTRMGMYVERTNDDKSNVIIIYAAK